MQVCTSLQTDNHASTPPLSFLQAGCPSCRPTTSVKALKGLPFAVRGLNIKEEVVGHNNWRKLIRYDKINRGNSKSSVSLTSFILVDPHCRRKKLLELVVVIVWLITCGC